MVLSDLPYGMTHNDWDIPLPMDELWKAYNRVVKEDGAVVLFCMQPFTSKLIMSNLKAFKYCWIWEKNEVSGFLNAKKQPLRNYEEIAVFYRKQCTYNPQMTKGKWQKKATGSRTTNYGKFNSVVKYNDDYYPRQVLKFPVARREKGHPTQKPVELLEYLIRTYTNEGETVLDNTMGGGSCGVASANTGREFIGIEKDDEYFEMARKKLTAREECIRLLGEGLNELVNGG